MIKYKCFYNEIDITKALNEGWKIIGQTWCGDGYGLQTSMILDDTKEIKKIPIDMWVARDKNNKLFLYIHKPYKYNDTWQVNIGNANYLECNNELYPNVTWNDNEPLKIN